ncbi:MAG: hypothetical protein N3E36_00315 [Sulfolobales archaeon]|nr:hypothetical protein [Sulfolobales archaeon]MCX8198471.1 hypothetical protein [Sulfolobales archaeon]MDW8169545.1 methionine synthase [Desulfurococcaceae archaeon]
MRTSHVGSFPLSYSKQNLEAVIIDLKDVGIDVPPYPQLRNFIDIYVEPLLREGVVMKSGLTYCINLSRIDLIDDVEVFVPEAEESIALMKKLLFKWFRAPVTGAFTLASKIYVEGGKRDLWSSLLSRRDVVLNYVVPYVRKAVEYMAKLGYTTVFLDEPILGLIIGTHKIMFNYSEEDVVNAINSIYRGLSIEKGIHICGKIPSRVFKLLVRIRELNYLNLEFYEARSNLKVVEAELLEEGSKYIAPGVVSSVKPRVEELSEVIALLSEVIKVSNGKIDLVSADCGFGGLGGVISREEAYRISLEKLKVLKKAVKTLNPQSHIDLST